MTISDHNRANTKHAAVVRPGSMLDPPLKCTVGASPALLVFCVHACEDKSLTFTEAHTKCISLQLLKGLNALHQKWFVHRDVTPTNILVSYASGVDSHLHLKTQHTPTTTS
eukprot:4815592-Amphidinium_carterae.1